MRLIMPRITPTNDALAGKVHCENCFFVGQILEGISNTPEKDTRARAPEL